MSKIIRNLQALIATLLLCAIAVALPTTSYAASSKGKEFFVTFHPNVDGFGNGNEHIYLYLTSEVDASGVVEVAGINLRQSFQTTAFETLRVELPISVRNYYYGPNKPNRAVKITSDQDITVYGFNQTRYTTDAYLALPVDTLGTEYYMMGYFSGGAGSQISITAVYDNTEIEFVTVRRKARIPRPPRIYKMTLNSGETFFIGNGDFVTGSKVTSSKPIAVLSGSWCTQVPERVYACDHIVEMLPPVSTWGNQFLTVPLATRKRGDFFRVVASQDNTEVRVNGSVVAMLDAGKFHEMNLTERSIISTSAPALVAQYSAGTRFDGVVSDPFMMLVPPAEQFLNSYTFEVLGEGGGFEKDFVNVVIPTADIESLILDGNAVDASLFLPIGNSGFSGAQIPVTEGSHTIKSSAAFGIYVYGFGQAESYGYPGGMNFDLINNSGDQYPPNLRLIESENLIQGIAGDSEDLNLNDFLDIGEDLNGNGIIDRRTEDINRNGKLDAGEDTNNDNVLDRDTGIFRIELADGAQNLTLNTDGFIPSSLKATFSITPTNSALPASGTLLIKDGGGNTVTREIAFNNADTLQNVRVISTLSTVNIDLDASSFAQQPHSIDVQTDKTLIEWRFDRITINQIEKLDYDIALKNPQAGERRLVTHKLELYFTDVEGKPVYQALAEQYVDVLNSAFTLATATDRLEYTANQNVLIDTNIGNLSQFATTATVNLAVLDAQNNLVADVGSFPLSLLANNNIQLDDKPFNTGTLLTGSYKVRATLLNAQNQQELTAEAAFNIIAPTASQYAAAVTTDKASYNSQDKVQAQSRISNPAPNAILTGAKANTSLIASTGAILWSQQENLPDIPVQGLRDYNYSIDLAAVIPGDYTVVLSVTDSQNNERARDEKTITVESTQNSGVGIKGAITANPAAVYITESTAIQATITNLGNSDVTNIPVKLSVVNIASQQVLQEWDAGKLSLAKGASISINQQWLANVDIGPQYLAVITAEFAGQTRVLASQQITVLEKLINQLTASNASRLLVLADPVKPTCTANRSVTLEGSFNQAISSHTQVYSKLYADPLWIKDHENVSVNDFVNQAKSQPVNSHHGHPDLSISKLTNERVQVTLRDSKALLGKYLVRHYVGFSLFNWQPQLQTGAINFSCGAPLQVGQQVGDLTVVGVENVELLADNPHQHVAEVPAMQSQHNALNIVLANRAHKVVDNLDSFITEMLSGQYQQYLLLSERQSLDHGTAKFLREAINRGEGVVFANGRAPYAQPLWEALGIVPFRHALLGHIWATGFDVHSGASHLYWPYQPKHWQADGIQLLESPLANAQNLHFGLQRLIPLVVADGATYAGSYHNLGFANGIIAYADMLAKALGYGIPHQGAAAASYANYGKGKAVYIGYDILAELTEYGVSTANNAHRELLTQSLSYSAPAELAKRAGGAVPVQLSINNLGNTAAITASMQWPQGSTVVDSLPKATHAAELANWSITLDGGQNATLTSWAVPKYTNNTAEVKATVSVGSGNTAVLYQQLALSLQASPSISLGNIKQSLQAAIDAEHNLIRIIKLQKAMHWLKKAEYFYQQGHRLKALALLLHSTTHLKAVGTTDAANVRLSIDEQLWHWGTGIEPQAN